MAAYKEAAAASGRLYQDVLYAIESMAATLMRLRLGLQTKEDDEL